MHKDINPYVGPRTFQRDEGHLFFGREREARELLGLVLSERLVLFYALSGAGKSSLVNARLIPELERKDREILLVDHISGDVPQGFEVENIYIYNLLSSLIQQETDLSALSTMSLTSFLHGLDVNERGYFFNKSRIPKRGKPEDENLPRRAVLVIDQFEQLFMMHYEAWEKREDFFRQLAQAMHDHPGLSIVLVVRQDLLAHLDSYASLVPGKLRVRYHMEQFKKEAAVAAVKNPAAMMSRPFAEGVAEKLVDDLSGIKVYRPDGIVALQPGQYVEPVQLQVVCHDLWDSLPAQASQITERDLYHVGDLDLSLANYYAQRVRMVAESTKVKERKIREWFTDRLISPYGTRNLILREPNGRVGGLDDDIVHALQELVRAEQRGGATFYELAHDRLVEPIIENNKRWMEENTSPLQRQAMLWNHQDRMESWLLADAALADVEQWARDHADELTDIEDEFLDASRKHEKEREERLESQRRLLELSQRLADEQGSYAQRTRRFSMVALGMIILFTFAFLTMTLRGDQDFLNKVFLMVGSLVLGYVVGRYRSK